MIGHLVFCDLVARGKSNEVAKQWKATADEFEAVCGLKNHYGRADIILYLGHLRARGLCQNTINKNLKPIKLLFELLDDTFPKLSLPRVKATDILRPAFTSDQVCQLISRGPGCLDAEELEYLAISTTYGLRRVELSKVCPGADDSHISIPTAKGSPLVRQLIPEQIRPYLGHVSPRSADSLTRIFHSICSKAEVEITTEYGWHSVRRTLTVDLVLLDVSALNIVRFMRWSEATVERVFGMLPIYAVKSQEMQEKVDRGIFRVHPYLSSWQV